MASAPFDYCDFAYAIPTAQSAPCLATGPFAALWLFFQSLPLTAIFAILRIHPGKPCFKQKLLQGAASGHFDYGHSTAIAIRMHDPHVHILSGNSISCGLRCPVAKGLTFFRAVDAV